MANPWDIPPLPQQADEDMEFTFAGVGYVMTQWEIVEVNLARLYSALKGKLDDYATMREYGEGRIFRDRLACVRRAADQFFIRHPDQNLEAIFLGMETQVLGFADRRNDVAHGVVYPISELRYFKKLMSLPNDGKKRYALIPPLYTIRRHDERGLPLYVYARAELSRLQAQISGLSDNVRDFRFLLLDKFDGQP